MQSKRELLDVISKVERDRYEYLMELFKDVPDVVVESIAYKETRTDQYILHAGMPCDQVYVILSQMDQTG